MARVHLDRRGVHALSHEAFEIRVDGAVLRGDGVEAGLQAPGGGVGSLAVQKRLMERFLDGVEHHGFHMRKVSFEISQEGLLGKWPLIAVVDDPGLGT